MQKIIGQIAAEIKVSAQQVNAAVELLDGGATVPFIARYRKEVTGGLDDVQLRELEARLSYLRELEDRRGAVLKAIDEQGKLTDVLRLAIANAPTKQELEDIYLPFKQKRRTKGQIAKEFGIEPLADKLFADPTLDPAVEAAAFTKPPEVLDDGKPGADFSTVPAVLDGVRDILSERWAEDPALVQNLREWLWAEGLLRSKKVDSKNENDPEVSKFRDYFDYDEPIGRVPSHRALAVFRGRGLEILEAKLVLPVEPEPGKPSIAEGKIALHLGWSHQGRVFGPALAQDVAHAVEHGRHGGEISAGLAVVQHLGGLSEGGGLHSGVQRRVGKQLVGQGLDAELARDLALGAALLLEGQVDVFQLLLGRRGGNRGAQRVGQLALLVDGLEHGGAAVFQFAQVRQAGFEFTQLDVVQPAGHFLAVTRDEGHGGPTVEQLDGSDHLSLGDADFFGNLTDDLLHGTRACGPICGKSGRVCHRCAPGDGGHTPHTHNALFFIAVSALPESARGHF